MVVAVVVAAQNSENLLAAVQSQSVGVGILRIQSVVVVVGNQSPSVEVVEVVVGNQNQSVVVAVAENQNLSAAVAANLALRS